jgi:type IV pilus assembly protein PilW
MVGLAIGLLLTGVILQVMSVFEVKTRTTTGTADAQTNGSIALYTIGRELQLAGFPLMPVTNSPLECETILPAILTPNDRLAPLSITDGVATASASDTITIRYGSTLMGGVPTQTKTDTPLGNNVAISVGSNFGCQVGDTSLITNGLICDLSSVTAVTTVTGPPLSESVTLATVNLPANTGVNLTCLGTWNEFTYRVNGGNLERNGEPTLTGIVSLQAQYGISGIASSNQVTQWVDASGLRWTTPVVSDRNRIKAIRLAVVARNEKKELTNVTTPCSSTTAAAPTGLCAWEGTGLSPAPTIDLSANDPDWLRYRYRVFETIIPLRNVIWSKDTL